MAEDRSLSEMIDLQIRQNGPMSIATYMGLALTHPRSGYYSGSDPLGAGGDFITAPEISQMFGELVGFFIVNLWQQLGEPKSFTLLELGPGRGTLMQDALRVAARAEGFIDALHLQLFESNPALRAQQQERLAQYNPYWASEIDAVAEDPLFVVANEFFDALPIRQFVKAADGWHERQVGLRDGQRAFGLSPTPIPDSAMPEAVRSAAPGEIYEVSLAAADVMQRLGKRIAAQRGALLAIDYGYAETQTGETLQAIRNHAFADPLEAPGETDLSAHVDFGALAQVATDLGLRTEPLATQRDFLARLGIVERATALARANPGQMDAIGAALKRLTDPAADGHPVQGVLRLGRRPRTHRVFVMTIPFEQSRALERLTGVRHGFFGRRGGVSTGDFASLNVSESSGDKLNHIAENRAQVAGILGFPPERLVTMKQVHSVTVLEVTRQPAPGERPEADAFVTRVPGLALGILTADCAPILLADPEAGVIGAAHAGWKGATGGIAEATVAAMVDLGARPDRIIAAIGPTISAANYEVGPDFAATLLRDHRDAANRISKPDGGREHFDLPGFVFDHLIAAGVGLVDDLGLCTYADPKRYFSHRYATHQGITTGRQISVIGLSSPLP